MELDELLVLELLVLAELEEEEEVEELGLPLMGGSDCVLLEGGGGELLELLRLATGGSGRELLPEEEVEGGLGVVFRVLLLLLVPSMIAISD